MSAGSSPGGAEGAQIVTFYSYKGGTGRTMALANVAWILAGRGYRVLAVDWDLESPALHRYYRPLLNDDFARTAEGVLDLLHGCANAMLDEPGELDGSDWYLDYTRVEDYATRVEWDFGGDGYLEIISAGKQDDAYAARIRLFEWRVFFRKLHGLAFLRALVDDMRANYDYVLLDSGAGINEISSLCTLTLPDVVVDCFRLNLQGIEGAAAVAESIMRHRPEAPIRVLPVPMCVDASDAARAQPLRDLARFRFDGRPLEYDGPQLDLYWADVEVPYHPRYACEETLAVFGDPGGDERGVLRAYERIAAAITGGAVDRLAPIGEPERRRVLNLFEVGTSKAPSEVLIGYAAVDRMWAEWIQATLALAGVRATYHEVGDHLDPREAAAFKDRVDRSGRLLLLLSEEFVRSTSGIEAWKHGLAQEWGGRRRFVLPVRTGQIELSGPFADRPPVEVAGRTWHDVRTALFEALHLTDSQPVAAITAEPSLAPRFPGDKPAVWNVPARSTTFIGRARLLEKLRNELSTEVTVIVPQALYGLGGVGKTQVAHEYANRFSADYDLVWWIPAEQPTDIPGHLEQLARALSIPASANLQDTVAEVLRSLGEGRPTSRWLLIFDNAEQPESVAPYIPAGTGHVLVTSRNPAWTDIGRPLHVGVFARTESIALLQRTVPRLSIEDADWVASKLGDLPLGVEQAAAYLAESGLSGRDYVMLLDAEPQTALPTRREGGYPETAAAIWTVSLDRIRAKDAAAAKLIELCSFFGPDRIPLSLIYSDVCVDILAAYDPEIALFRDPTSIAPKVQELSKYALLQEDVSDASGQGVIYVHRLVQAVIRDNLQRQPGAWDTNRAEVHRILASFRRGDPDDSRTWDGYQEITPHLRPSKAQMSKDVDVRRLLIDAVRYLHKRGHYDSCIELADLAIEEWSARSDPDHALVLLMRVHRTNSLRSKGLYQDAYDESRQVHARLTAAVGPNHAYTLMSANGLGADHRTFGRYADARALDETTVALYKEHFGDNNRGTLMALNNLAVSLRLVGEFREAERLDKETWERRRKVMPDHTYTLFSASNYGRDLRETGQFADSRKVLEKALQDYRNALGGMHPDTLRTAKNLAVTLRKIGELAQARELTGWALDAYRQIVREDHLDYLACLLNLACDASALDDDALAQQYAEDVLARYARLLGPGHMFTLACRNNLGIFLRRQRDHVSARGMAEAVVEGFHRTLGIRHPYVYAAELNLANDLFALGEIEQSFALDRQTVSNLSASLGQDHPDTLAASVNLSISRARAGETGAAAALLQATLARMLDVLGPGHPNVLQVRSEEGAPLAVRTRFNCDIEPPPT